MTVDVPLHVGLLDLTAVAWTAGDIGRFVERRARLMRWGWGVADAEALAGRLVCRDRSGDIRASCTECHNYRPGWCVNHIAAGLGTAEVGRDLAGLLQRCQGFAAAANGATEATDRPATRLNRAGQYPDGRVPRDRSPDVRQARRQA